MPCVDHDYRNCPAYMELRFDEQCKQTGCQRKKAPVQTSPALFQHGNDDLESVVIPGKTGGRQGTI